ncbi:MAG TPA: GNAT family N-acetyltransferase, partial [Myxococcales bacterium]|nr:GNAT family N-acetyltransferase [Myxococcales bacterium]
MATFPPPASSRFPVSSPSPLSSPARSSGPPPSTSNEWRIRPLKRGDREAAFKLLAADGWVVPAQDQEAVLSWVVQHPELESFVAHDALSYTRILAMITMSHRPQLRLGGRVASIDLFVVAPEHRHKGIGHDL